jgi:hypothetical protein
LDEYGHPYFDQLYFVYDGRIIYSIDIAGRGRVNQTRAEIQELTLRSPIAKKPGRDG